MAANLTAQRSARTRGRRRFGAFAKLGLIVLTALLAYLAIRGLDLQRSWRAVREANPLWLAPAFGALALALFARALRWRSLFAPGRRPPLGAVGNAMMIGYLYNNILPARSGEVARVLVLNRRSDAQPVEIAGTALLERVYDLVGVLLIFFVAMPWLPHVGWVTAAAIAAGALAIAILLAVLALARWGERALHTLLAPLRWLPRLGEQHVERAVSGLGHGLSGLRRPGVALEGFSFTILAWMLNALLAYLVALAFNLQLPFASGVLVTVVIGLAMIIPSPPAAVGVFEAAALIGLKAYGLSYSAALPFALVLHLVNFLPFILVGVVLLHHNSRPSASAGERARSKVAIGSANAS